ncbi:hypothetical protein OAN38_03870 [Candidatus Marinimicrobia bacterium]|jgi:hypothetical protein|nr:hypothetical protein [Candidatus Neomarinimicrobiota bacterium]MDC0383963.1 hypothetical protein [Candidatus Neomarinimicrobiota bacterium]
MTNFNSLDDSLKEKFKYEINDLAKSFGGKSHFLQLIEEIRLEKPHPLMSKNSTFRFRHGTVKWEKVLYRDKVHLLIDLLRNNINDGNLMFEKGNKRYKAVLNLLRTLGPMKFKFKPKNNNDGEGFVLRPLELIDSKITRMNFMFEVVFFLPTHVVKQVFNGPKR